MGEIRKDYKLKNALKNILLISIPTLLMLVLVLEFVVFRIFLPATEWPDYIFDTQHQILRINPEGPKQGLHTKGKWAKDHSMSDGKII